MKLIISGLRLSMCRVSRFPVGCLIALVLCASCCPIGTVKKEVLTEANAVSESEVQGEEMGEAEASEECDVCPETAEDAIEAIEDPAEQAFYKKYSRILGLRLDGTENKRLLASVSRWLGVPYKWGGCTKKGVDCSCFVKKVYKEAYDVNLRRTAANIFYKDMVPAQDGFQEGDVLSFKIKDNRISHIGIYMKDDKFAHVSLSSGVRISNLNGKYYRKRFFAAGRMPGLEKKVLMASSSDAAPRGSGRIKLGKLTVFNSLSDKLENPSQTSPALLAKASR